MCRHFKYNINAEMHDLTENLWGQQKKLGAVASAQNACMHALTYSAAYSYLRMFRNCDLVIIPEERKIRLLAPWYCC